MPVPMHDNALFPASSESPVFSNSFMVPDATPHAAPFAAALTRFFNAIDPMAVAAPAAVAPAATPATVAPVAVAPTATPATVAPAVETTEAMEAMEVAMRAVMNISELLGLRVVMKCFPLAKLRKLTFSVLLCWSGVNRNFKRIPFLHSTGCCPPSFPMYWHIGRQPEEDPASIDARFSQPPLLRTGWPPSAPSPLPWSSRPPRSSRRKALARQAAPRRESA